MIGHYINLIVVMNFMVNSLDLGVNLRVTIQIDFVRR